MTRKRGRRHPGMVSMDPLAKLAPALAAERKLLIGRYRSDLEAMARGQDPSIDDWRELSDVVNLVETLTLVQGLLDIDATMPAVRAATDGMVAAAARYRATGRFGLDGAGLQALREVVDIYEQAAAGFTRYVMTEASRLTRARISEALKAQERGETPAGVEVVSL